MSQLQHIRGCPLWQLPLLHLVVPLLQEGIYNEEAEKGQREIVWMLSIIDV
jgi:hypothetical protein